jgi:hypothetical protein
VDPARAETAPAPPARPPLPPPSPTHRRPPAAHTLSPTARTQPQTLHQARLFIDRDFEELCEEAQLGDKLQALETLCAEQGLGEGAAGAGAPAGPPPSRAARAAALHARRDEAAHLAAVLAEVERGNAEAGAALEAARGEAQRLLAGAGALEARLEGARTACKAWTSRAGPAAAAAAAATT